MQAKQLKGLIDRYETALGGAAMTEAATWMRTIADALGTGGTRTTANVLSTIEKAGFEPEATTGPTLGNVVPVVNSLLLLLKEAGAKKAAVADLELLLDVARRHSEVSLTRFLSSAQRSVASASRGKAKPGAPAVDTKQLIESYLQRLEAALGKDAAFRAIHRELTTDKHVTRVEAVEIASRFLEPLAPSTTRPKALQRILYRHEKLLDSRAASSTIGGQAA
jgi:hypothetical protein